MVKKQLIVGVLDALSLDLASILASSAPSRRFGPSLAFLYNLTCFFSVFHRMSCFWGKNQAISTLSHRPTYLPINCVLEDLKLFP